MKWRSIHHRSSPKSVSLPAVLYSRVYIPRRLPYSRLQSCNPTTQTQPSSLRFLADYRTDPRVQSHVQRILQPRRRRQGRPGQDALHQPRSFRVASLEDLVGHDVLVSLASSELWSEREKVELNRPFHGWPRRVVETRNGSTGS
jgi:hypothetical protein